MATVNRNVIIACRCDTVFHSVVCKLLLINGGNIAEIEYRFLTIEVYTRPA